MSQGRGLARPAGCADFRADASLVEKVSVARSSVLSMRTEVDELDAAEALVAFGDLRRARDLAERDIFVLAAHMADLYNVDADTTGKLRSLPGGQRALPLGGDGAPAVLEFAVAEIAAELHMTTTSAKKLVADALTVRHRLPRLWQRVYDGSVPSWRARKVAQATRHLTKPQAIVVDDNVADYADGRLAYSRFMDKVAAEVVAADPDAAVDAERKAAEQEFAKVGQANTHGRKTLYVKSSAAELTRIDATISYLAEALRALGDTDNEDRRRTKAVLLMANPLQALELMQALKAARSRNSTAQSAGSSTAEASHEPAPTEDPAPTEHPPWPHDDSLPADLPEGSEPDAGSGGGPSPNDAPSPPPGGSQAGAGSRRDPPYAGPIGDRPDAGRNGPDDPRDPPKDDPPPDAPGWGKSPPSDPVRAPDRGDAPGRPVAEPSAGPPRPEEAHLEPFFTPFHPDQVPACACQGGRWAYDPAKLLPTANLYLHVHADTLEAGNGVARWEGEGPISWSYVRDVLGPQARFVVKGVIDPAAMPAVDNYEIPERLREGLHLRTPFDIFPYASSTSRKKQVDHNRPYVPEERNGGLQTGLHNLGGMTTFHHRAKTFGGWRVEQPFPGVYVWMSPHGSVFVVDNTGTRQLRGPQATGQRRIDLGYPGQSPATARLVKMIDDTAA
jgi:hypothetical protein